jgi:hypothetical protein
MQPKQKPYGSNKLSSSSSPPNPSSKSKSADEDETAENAYDASSSSSSSHPLTLSNGTNIEFDYSITRFYADNTANRFLVDADTTVGESIRAHTTSLRLELDAFDAIFYER